MPEDFRTTNDIEIAETGFRKFFRLYEKQMGNTDGENPGLRQFLDTQAQLLKKHILGELKYQPFNVTLALDK